MVSLNIPRTNRKRVVVIGGGFAGLGVVKGLRKSEYQVVLIDRNNFHLFKPLLYQVASAGLDEGDIAFPFRKVFHHWHNVFFRMAQVMRVMPKEKRIETSLGSLDYDYLVIATGSVPDFYGMTNVQRHALAMNDAVDAINIRTHLLRSFELAVTASTHAERLSLLNVVIVGGGATGVEIAGAIAEMKRYVLHKDYRDMKSFDMDIYLVEAADRLLGTMSADTSAKTYEALEKREVKIMLNSPVADYVNGRVVFRDGSSIPTCNMIWSSGVKCEPIEGIRSAGREPQGRITVDGFNRVKGMDDVFAVGDIAIGHEPDAPEEYPRLARPAISQGQQLAANLLRAAEGKPWKPYRYRNLGIMATVGRNRAFVEFPDIHYGGFAAWVTWSFVHVVFVLGIQNKVKVFWGWVWNYFLLDQPLRLIISKYHMPETAKTAAGGAPKNACTNIPSEELSPEYQTEGDIH